MRPKKSYSYFALIFVSLPIFCLGCSQPIRTLKALGQEQDAQKRYVAEARSHFSRLLGDLRQEKIGPGTPLSVVISRYGEPISEEAGVLLYRDPVDFLHSDKVYLTFDENNKLVKYKIETRNAE